MRISDWSSDVCSSDLLTVIPFRNLSLGFNGSAVDSRVDKIAAPTALGFSLDKSQVTLPTPDFSGTITGSYTVPLTRLGGNLVFSGDYFFTDKFGGDLGENLPGYHLTNFRITWNGVRSEEHTSELQSLMRISYAVFCLKKKK